MSATNTKVCLQALKKCSHSSQNFKHGAVIAKGKKIIVYGVNNSRSTINGSYSSCVHAEVDAVHKWLKIILKGKTFNNKNERVKYIQKKGKKYKLYVVRENKSSNEYLFSNSKPCVGCTEILKTCNFKVVYSHHEDKIITTKANKLDNPITTSGIRTFPIKISKKNSINTNLVFGAY